MAVVTLLGTQTFDTNTGTHTVVATPALGDLIILVVANTGYTGTTLPTDNNTDGLGTYTLVNSSVKAVSVDTLQVYVRNALVGSATSTTFTAGAASSTGGGLGVLKVTGMLRTGINAVVQSAVQSNQAAAGTPAPVLSAVPNSQNPVIGAVFNATSAATMTPRASYTELFDVGYATPTTGLEVMKRDNSESSATITWGGTSASAFCSIALELNTSVGTNFVPIGLSDDFNASSIDATKWTSFHDGATAVSQSGQLNITTTTTSGFYGGYISVNSFNMTGKISYVQIVNAGNFATVPSLDIGLKMQIDASNSVLLVRGANSLFAKQQVAGVSSTVGTSTTYSATDHAWFGIAELNGITYWLVSGNGSLWYIFQSKANPIAVTALVTVLTGGIDGAEASTTTYILDNYNLQILVPVRGGGVIQPNNVKPVIGEY